MASLSPSVFDDLFAIHEVHLAEIAHCLLFCPAQLDLLCQESACSRCNKQGVLFSQVGGPDLVGRNS